MRDRNHEYKFTMPIGSPHHKWTISGPSGEMVARICCYPDGDQCVISFRHDSSTARIFPFAKEQLWTDIKKHLAAGEQYEIFRILDRMYLEHFEPEAKSE